MSIIIVLAAATQWILIRNIPSRVGRVALQVPLLIITFFAAWFFGQFFENREVLQQQEAREARILDTLVVERGDLVVSVNATGTITPLRQLPLAFQLSGVPVQQVNVQSGQRVNEGDIIASLEASDFEVNLADAELGLQSQQQVVDALTAPARVADIEAAEAALTAAQAQFNAAVQTAPGAEEVEIARLQSEIARNQLWQGQLQRDNIGAPPPLTIPPEIGAILPEEVEEDVASQLQSINAENEAQAETQRLSANSGLQQLEIGVDIADLQLQSTRQRGADPGAVASANAQRTQAQIALEQLQDGPDELQLQLAGIGLETAELAVEQAQQALEQARLRAPFDGILAQNNLTVGELPPQGAAVVLLDDSGYYVDLPVDETDIVDVQPGQRVEFDVDALPDATVTGIVESIAYTPIDVEQLVAYNTRVRLTVEDVPIRAGMTVTGSIIIQERDDVLLVRNNFIRFNRVSGDAFVTVRRDNGTFEEQMVILGERNERFSEVQSGLEAGETLVLLPREEDDNAGLFGG
jgi:HlyD family secretion protein